MTIFPDLELTETEELLLVEIYKNPTVKKHLNLLAYNLGRDLIALPVLVDDTTEKYIHASLHVKGGLSVLDTLLSIGATPTQPTNKE